MTDVSPHPTADELDAFRNGRLSRGPHSAVERHVERCNACLSVLTGLPDGPFARLAREAGLQVSVSDNTPLPGSFGLRLE